MIDAQTLAASMSYTKATVEGAGAIKGKDGVSPAIAENPNNTKDIYKLDITDATHTFTTPNLKGKDGSGGGAGGSIIAVSTAETTLRGKTVTITDATGNEEASATFDSDGNAEIEGFTGVGNCTLSATDGYLTGEKSISISAFSRYTETLSLWKAVLDITVEDGTQGQIVSILNESSVVIATVELDASGACEYILNAPGTYTVSTLIDGETVNRTLTVSTTGIYDVDLSAFTVFGVVIDNHSYVGGAVTSSDPDEIISYEVEYESGKPVKNYNYHKAENTTSGSVHHVNLHEWEDAFFMPKLCVINLNDDTIKYVKSITGDIITFTDDSTLDMYSTNSQPWHQFMIEFPKAYIKIESPFEANTPTKILVSNAPLDENYHAYPFLDADNVEHSAFYLGTFLNTNFTSAGAIASVPYKSNTHEEDNFTDAVTRTSVLNNKSSRYTFNIMPWCAYSMYLILFQMLFKSTDSQTALGMGEVGSATTPAGESFRTQLAESANTTISGTDLLFYGLQDSAHKVRAFGIEDIWGCKLTYMAGSKLEYIGPSSLTGIRINGGINGPVIATGGNDTSAKDSGFIAKVWFNSAGVYTGPIMTAQSGASSSTFYCDKSTLTGGYDGVPAYGGRAGHEQVSGDGAAAGLYSLTCNSQTSATSAQKLSWWGGTRLIAWPKED